MQRAINTIIEEVVFLLWFTYIHYWETDIFTDVFSLRPPRDYVNSPVVKYLSVHPCGGGVENTRRDPASRKRRRKGNSQI
jgi:hypothetical protein